MLQAQHFLDRLCKALKDAAAKEDLAEGKNGASKLTKEQIDAVFEFSRAVGDKATSDFDKSGELWNCLVESRKQKVGKSSSTFKEAMEALELTIACGYLDNLKVEKDRGITVKAQTASVIYKVSTYCLIGGTFGILPPGKY